MTISARDPNCRTSSSGIVSRVRDLLKSGGIEEAVSLFRSALESRQSSNVLYGLSCALIKSGHAGDLETP